MKTYRQLRRRKEFHCIQEIRNRLDKKDFIKCNSYVENQWKKMFDKDHNLIGYETGFIRRSYVPDIWYLFDLLEWARQKKYTL